MLTYGLLALALSWPLPLHFSTHLTGDPSGDTGVYVWNLWQFRHELAQGRDPFGTSSLFVPSGRTSLALHNYTVFANLLSIPLWPWLGLVATFNALYLFLTVLDAWAMFLLARHITGRVGPAWLAGVLFAFSPFLTARGTAHFSLVAAAPLPVFVLLLLKMEKTGQARYAAGAGLTVAWALYCDPYYAVFCVLIALVYLACAVLRVHAERRARPTAVRHALDSVLAGLVVLVGWITLTGGTRILAGGQPIGLRSAYTPALLALFLLAVRLWLTFAWRLRLSAALPLRAWARLFTLGALTATLALAPFLHAVAGQIGEGDFAQPEVHWRSSPKGVDALAFLMPNPNHRLFGGAGYDWLRRERADGFPENVAALTLVAPAVIVAGFRRRRAGAARWAAFFAFFALLALGPFIWVAGVNTSIPTPWALLRYVPVIGLVRSPARFAVVAMLGVSILFALALAELLRRYRAHPLRVVAAVAVVVLFELAPLPRPLYSAQVPEIFHTIAGDPRDVRVLELPTGLRDGTWSTGEYTATTQFHQTVHGKAVIGGYLSRLSPRCVRSCRRFPVLDALFTLSSGETLTPVQRRRAFAARARFLRRARVGYVVMDTQRTSEHLRRYAIRLLGLVKMDEDGRYELYVPDPQLGMDEGAGSGGDEAAGRYTPHHDVPDLRDGRHRRRGPAPPARQGVGAGGVRAGGAAPEERDPGKGEERDRRAHHHLAGSHRS